MVARIRTLAFLGIAAVLTGCGGPGTEPAPKSDQVAVVSSDAVDPASFGDPVGAGCAGIPTKPEDKGSFAAMAQLPVSEAIAVNPILKRFAKALKDLPDLATQLDKATDLTLFVPADGAFTALGPKPLAALVKNAKVMEQVVTYAVVPQRVVPPDLTKPGELPTLIGPDTTLGVTIAAGVVTLNDKAHIVCSNVLTANATLYVTDAVLRPPA